MAHFGILCLEATSHLNTIFPLGRELQRRGHCVTVFSGSGAQTKAQAAGFSFCYIYSAGDRKRGGETQTPSAKVEKLRRLASIRYTLEKFAQIAQTRLQQARAIIKQHGVEALLVDFSVFEGGTIADHLNLPYVTVCCLLPFYQDPTIPPIATSWQYNNTVQIRRKFLSARQYIELLCPVCKQHCKP